MTVVKGLRTDRRYHMAVLNNHVTLSSNGWYNNILTWLFYTNDATVFRKV